MQLRVEKDRSRPLGYARIVMEGVQLPPTARKFVLRREGYQEANLGAHGWQVREEALEPIEVSVEDGATCLIVGPEVTRHLDPAAYVFQVVDSEVDGFVFWPDDIDYFDGTVQKRVEPPVEPAGPEANAVPSEEANALPEAAAKPAAPSLPGNSVVGSIPAGPHGARNLRRVGLLALLVVLLAVGGGAWWAYPLIVQSPPSQGREGQTPLPAGPTSTASGAAGAQPGGPAAATPPAPIWPDGTDQLDVKEVVARAPNAAAILAVALRRQAAGKYQDTLLLFEEAADRGNAQAMTGLAKLYDPNGFVAGRPFANPDGRTAADYYKRAVEKGDPEAAAHRAALRTTLEAEARAGSGSAAAALKESWP